MFDAHNGENFGLAKAEGLFSVKGELYENRGIIFGGRENFEFDWRWTWFGSKAARVVRDGKQELQPPRPDGDAGADEKGFILDTGLAKKSKSVGP